MSGVFANRMDRTLWKGGWREIGGYRKYYRSRWEANYARYLEHLRAKEEVVSWAHEPKTFWFEGIKRGVNNYLPDFQVVYPGERGEEYHEVKGWMDTKSATKIKRMAKYHPTVRLVIIDRKIYNGLEREFGKIIESWEFLEKESPATTPAPTAEKTERKRGPTKKKLRELETLLEETPDQTVIGSSEIQSESLEGSLATNFEKNAE